VEEPEEAEECFFHDYDFCNDERFDDIYILMVAQIAADVCGSSSRTREIGSLAFSRVGNSNPRQREKDEKAIWQVT